MEKESIDTAIKRFMYTTLAEIGFVASLTVAKSEGMIYAGKMIFAIWATYFSIPIALFTDLFSGLTYLDWYVVIVSWIASFTIWRYYE